ncbi:C2H2-type zinc finger protein [Halorussus lipolyticus]|uniref:C2H2-type zinc finger protein n=1 Tax=Halorussus lipolyticus TaxID=3034024 RepID=UPI0023E78AF3|nr:C2H2-type zinc finger protein [Halorussus sp. DT80]
MTDATTYDTDVPSGESPAECPYCGRPLESEKLLVLHEGIDHWERLDDARREEFRATYTDESDDLRTFRLKLLGLLVVVYFAFLFAYSVVMEDPLAAAFVGFGAIPEARAWPDSLR